MGGFLGGDDAGGQGRPVADDHAAEPEARSPVRWSTQPPRRGSRPAGVRARWGEARVGVGCRVGELGEQPDQPCAAGLQLLHCPSTSPQAFDQRPSWVPARGGRVSCRPPPGGRAALMVGGCGGGCNGLRGQAAGGTAPPAGQATALTRPARRAPQAGHPICALGTRCEATTAWACRAWCSGCRWTGSGTRVSAHFPASGREHSGPAAGRGGVPRRPRICARSR